VSHAAVKSFDRRGVSCKNARTVQFSGGVEKCPRNIMPRNISTLHYNYPAYQCQIMFGMLPVKHHVFLRKVRFLLRFKNSDNLICSLFLDNASSEIKLICKKYSANVNNIFIHALDVLHLERDWTVYLLCLVKLFVVFILLPFGE